MNAQAPHPIPNAFLPVGAIQRILPLIAFAILAPLAARAADTGLALYEAGKFAEAEKALIKEVQAAPEDWTLRHNLGLAVAQQEKWPEAAAYWTSAFLLHPRSDELRWNLRLAMSKTSSYHPTLSRMLRSGTLESFAAYASPAEWENGARLAIAAAGALFCVAVILLFAAKRRPLAFLTIAGGTTLIALSLAAGWAHRTYEDLANPSAMAVVKSGKLQSVPTDLPADQIETDLPEGAIVAPIKTFLGWRKIELPNDEQGWARSDRFIPLYGPLK